MNTAAKITLSEVSEVRPPPKEYYDFPYERTPPPKTTISGVPHPPKLRRMNASENVDSLLEAESLSSSSSSPTWYAETPPPDPEWVEELERRAKECLDVMEGEEFMERVAEFKERGWLPAQRLVKDIAVQTSGCVRSRR